MDVWGAHLGLRASREKERDAGVRSRKRRREQHRLRRGPEAR